MTENQKVKPGQLIAKSKQPARRPGPATSEVQPSEVQPSNDTAKPPQTQTQPEKPSIIKKSKNT